jgi:hypothetical protein
MHGPRVPALAHGYGWSSGSCALVDQTGGDGGEMNVDNRQTLRYRVQVGSHIQATGGYRLLRGGKHRSSLLRSRSIRQAGSEYKRNPGQIKQNMHSWGRVMTGERLRWRWVFTHELQK